MSQEGVVDIIGTHPEIPTQFDANVGFAIPIANTLEVLGEVIPAAGVPFQSVASGNTVTYQVQYASSAAATDPTEAGLASFDSAYFTVDADGFVTFSGSATTQLQVDAHTPPGTDPVVPLGGIITVTGAQVAAGVVGTNVIRTDSLAANTMTIEIQRSQAVATTTLADNGVCHFDSAAFDVDANGFVQLNGGGIAATQFIPNSGTSPVVPTSAGVVNVVGTGSTTVVGSLNTLTIQLTGLTNHNVLIGAGTATITKVAPSATSGVPLISQGASADPVFGTAVVAGGGTGAVTFTAHSLLLGQGTSPITALGAATNGQLPIGSTGADPVLATLTQGTGISITNGAGSITIASSITQGIVTINGDTGSVTGTTVTLTGGTTGLTFAGVTATMTMGGTLIVANGGTGRTTLTNHGVLVGAGTSAITQLSVGATGTVLAGSTGADPSFTTTPALSGIVLNGGQTLSTYVNGSFTPGVAFGGGTTGITYGAQVGQYTQIGNVVYFTFLVQLTNKGSSTGSATLTGFPVAAAGNQCVMTAIKMTNFTINAGYTSVFMQTSNATSFGFFAHDPTLGDAAVTNTQFANNTDIRFIGFYFTS